MHVFNSLTLYIYWTLHWLKNRQCRNTGQIKGCFLFGWENLAFMDLHTQLKDVSYLRDLKKDFFYFMKLLQRALALFFRVLNISRIGKLPYGAKRGFIEWKALLKERLYWKKGFIERKAFLKERLFWNKRRIEKL